MEREGRNWHGEPLSLPWTLPRYHLEVAKQKNQHHGPVPWPLSPWHWVVWREEQWKVLPGTDRLDELLSSR